MSLLRRLARDLRPDRSSPPETASTLEARMADLGVPGVGAVMIQNGGIADIESFGVTVDAGSPVSASTLFQAASLSKLVAALAVLRLVDVGRLSLDVDVATVLRRWALPRGGSGAAVTLRQLLGHSAGTTVHGFPGYLAGAPLPTLTEILEGAGPCNTPPVVVDQVPGSAWRYSGGGYMVVQQVLEDVTSEPFEAVANELVLAPLGMVDSDFAQPLPPDRAARAAWPHDAAGRVLPGGVRTYPERAAAGLWSTPTDLARLALGIQRAAAGGPGAILSVALTRQMLTPGLGSWGLGPVLAADRSRAAFGHNGANAGFRSWLWVHVDGPGLVVMANGDNGQLVAEEMYRAGERAGIWGP